VPLNIFSKTMWCEKINECAFNGFEGIEQFSPMLQETRMKI